jgi:hypothetical protein
MKPSLARLFAAALALLLGLPACGLFRNRQQPPDEEKANEPTGPRPIGSIALVSPEARFVLIHLIHRSSPPPVGFVMRCFGADGQETGQIVITPEKKGSHMAADIKSGTPAIGDTVVADIGSAKPTGAATAAPGNPALGLPGDTLQPGRLINGLPDPSAPGSGAVLSTSQPSSPVPGQP